MNGEQRTIGEQHFEKYLSSQRLTDFTFEQEHPGKSKRPDYTVRADGREYLFEVKDFTFDESTLPEPGTFPVIAYDPRERIREKINEG